MNKLYEALATGERDEPWSLHRNPNYACARALESVDAASITPQEFHRRFVARNRPCVVRGAARHWPASELWRSPDYLKSKVPDVMLEARSAPTLEYLSAIDEDIREELARQDKAVYEQVSFHDFVDRASSSPEQFVLHSVSLSQRNSLGQLLDDIGNYAFMPDLIGSRMYMPFRAFFYRHSYTDWHFHSSDETLMTQVVGRKEALLLPPDWESWNAMWPVVRQAGKLYQVDTGRFPQFAGIRPFRAVVEEGDALFIPVYWWHAVASTDNRFGVTVAATFKTPLHINADWRLPGTRRLLQRFLTPRTAPMIIGALLYSLLRRLVLADFGRTPRYAQWD